MALMNMDYHIFAASRFKLAFSMTEDDRRDFFPEVTPHTPESSPEIHSADDSPSDPDAPLCLVVKKHQPHSKSHNLPTPPGSPPDSRYQPTTISGIPLTLSSPLRVDIHSHSSANSSNAVALHEQRHHCISSNNIPLLSPVDFIDSPIFARALASGAPKRPRGEKKPIPEEQKDNKYFERRKRNNLAAKKSRDARKSREDQIAYRATSLEKENAILRAQVLTLREEADSLRHLLIQKKKF